MRKGRGALVERMTAPPVIHASRVRTPLILSGVFQINSLVYKTDPENYHKVTFLPTLGKIFELVLKNRLKFKKNVSSDKYPFQTGFKANSRTADNICVFYSLVQQYKRLKKPFMYVL